MARARKTEVGTASIIFNLDSFSHILPRFPSVVFGAVTEPADLKLEVTSKWATIIGVTVLKDGVNEPFLILSSSNGKWVNVGGNTERMKAGDMNLLGAVR
jgi:hypothetical protein